MAEYTPLSATLETLATARDLVNRLGDERGLAAVTAALIQVVIENSAPIPTAKIATARRLTGIMKHRLNKEIEK